MKRYLVSFKWHAPTRNGESMYDFLMHERPTLQEIARWVEDAKDVVEPHVGQRPYAIMMLFRMELSS